MANTVYDFEVKNINAESVSLGQWRDKVLLIVNVASKCGFTSQYTGLEELEKKYGPRGFAVLGFPCNQFGAQEPGDEEEIKNFCQMSFGVTFSMFSKIDVNGDQAHPLYEYLKDKAPGLLGTKAVKWNFTKFLIGKDGLPIKRFAPQDKPQEIAGEIENLL
jgi:glutathione peroxidase